MFNVTQLGTESTMRTFDLTAVTYLKKISLDYYEIQGNSYKIRNNSNRFSITFEYLKHIHLYSNNYNK